MTDGADTLARDAAPDDAASAGDLLRAGREAAGLSVAAVAQQLKLAPRQITALEDGDWASLPGRTFIRGFVRNYARLLRLDTDTVLAALPETVTPPANEHPSLAPTPRPMGELPAAANAGPSAARWAIPLVLVAFVVVGAVYELSRSTAEPARATGKDKAMLSAAPTSPNAASSLSSSPSSTASAPAASPSSSESAPGNAMTTLPNPLAAGDDKANAATRKPDGVEPPAGMAPTVDIADTPIALSFLGSSWVEVRDGTGVLILSITGNPGATQSVGGKPPFEVILGNAMAVNVSWQGKAFDTTPFTRQNVARFTLK